MSSEYFSLPFFRESAVNLFTCFTLQKNCFTVVNIMTAHTQSHAKKRKTSDRIYFSLKNHQCKTCSFLIIKKISSLCSSHKSPTATSGSTVESSPRRSKQRVRTLLTYLFSKCFVGFLNPYNFGCQCTR